MCELFNKLKNDIVDLISNNRVVDSNTDYKNGGIYLLYVDNFDSETILPIYIGKTKNFQERYKEHVKDLMSINRLSKKYYEYALGLLYFNGRYKGCKIFDYMVNNNCTLKDLKMIILVDCDDENERSLLEYQYINKYYSSIFGFNQLNLVSLMPDYRTNGFMAKYYSDSVDMDFKNIIKYHSYGYCYFNYYLCNGLFRDYDKAHNLIIKNEYFERINKLCDEKNTLKKELFPFNRFYNFDLFNECYKLCENYFEKNHIGSYDMQKQIINYILGDGYYNLESLNKYLKRYIKKDADTIVSELMTENKKNIDLLIKKEKESIKNIEDINQKLFDIELKLHSQIIPINEYDLFPLKDRYVESDINCVNDNKLYINVEFSNHGRKRLSLNDEPIILKIDYSINKIHKSYFIKSCFDDFLNSGDYYIINSKGRFDIKGPTSIEIYKIGENDNSISTAMEFYNGINEYTISNQKKYDLNKVIDEIDCLINEDTKIVYSSGCKSAIKFYKEKYPNSLLLSKLLKSIR